MDITITPASPISGVITVPGDKSISHRALILAALAEGGSTVANLSPGLDVRSTRTCLEQLGIRISGDGGDLTVYGQGSSGLRQPAAPLDAGNSGTTMRLLTGVLAAQPFISVITGDQYLCKRPMQRIIDPLTLMGAQISSSSSSGKAPLTINGTSLRPLVYTTPLASAQVKSCLLLAGLFCSGRSEITEPAPSRDHTERMLPCFGAAVSSGSLTTILEGPAPLQAAGISIPGDISSAAFFMTAAAMIPGSRLTLLNVGVNPSRTGIITVLRRMGARIHMEHTRCISGEPRADITVDGSGLQSTDIAGNEIPALIDEIPVLAVAASQAEGVTEIRDAEELRCKESDRINAVAVNLRRMGVALETRRDGLVIPGPQKLSGAVIDSCGDHRIAMAFAAAGLAASGKTVISDAGCADISFPGFFDRLKDICCD